MTKLLQNELLSITRAVGTMLWSAKMRSHKAADRPHSQRHADKHNGLWRLLTQLGVCKVHHFSPFCTVFFTGKNTDLHAAIAEQGSKDPNISSCDRSMSGQSSCSAIEIDSNLPLLTDPTNRTLSAPTSAEQPAHQ